MTTRIQGTVKWFDTRKGFGFIQADESSDDVFVHFEEIQTDEKFKLLDEGQRVEFDLFKREQGWAAKDVHPIAVE